MAGNDFYERSLARQAERNWAARRLYQQVYAKPSDALPDPVKIDENTLILGHSDKNFTRDNLRILKLNRVAPNGEKRTFTAAIVAPQGSGKSLMLAQIAYDNFCNRLHEKVVVVDPQKEHSAHRDPNPEQAKAGDELLKSYNVPEMRRRGYDMVTASAHKLGYRSDVRFSIRYTDIMEVYDAEPEEALRLTLELLGIDQDDSNAVDVVRISLKTKFLKWAQFIAEIESQRNKRPVGTGRVLRKLYFAKEDRMISDKPNEGLEVYRMILDHEVLIFEVAMRNSDQPSYIETATNAMLKIQLSRITYAMEAWNKWRRESSPLHLDWLAAVLDEVGVYAGVEKTSTATFIVNLVAKMRKAGMDVLIADQSKSRINPDLFDQCAFLFSAKLTEANAEAFKARGIRKEKITELMTLQERQETSINTYVPWWFVLTDDNSIVEYLPDYTLSKYMKR